MGKRSGANEARGQPRDNARVHIEGEFMAPLEEGRQPAIASPGCMHHLARNRQGILLWNPSLLLLFLLLLLLSPPTPLTFLRTATHFPRGAAEKGGPAGGWWWGVRGVRGRDAQFRVLGFNQSSSYSHPPPPLETLGNTLRLDAN